MSFALIPGLYSTAHVGSSKLESCLILAHFYYCFLLELCEGNSKCVIISPINCYVTDSIVFTIDIARIPLSFFLYSLYIDCSTVLQEN